MKTAPLTQVEAMSAKEFFESAAELLKLHPPKATDYSQVWRMARIGIVPDNAFDFDALDSSTKDQIEKGQVAAYSKIKAHSYKLGTEKDGWNLLLGTLGFYGIQYLQRASVALFGLGCNQLADAYYPVLTNNAGPSKETYVLPFDKGQTPPRLGSSGRSPCTTMTASPSPTPSTERTWRVGWTSPTARTGPSTCTSG